MRTIRLNGRIQKDRTQSVQLAEDIHGGPAEVIGIVPEGGGPSALPPVNELDAIALHCASLPVLDATTADEILGYAVPSWLVCGPLKIQS
jgi:hypothetical protein